MNKKEDINETLKFYIETKIPGSLDNKAEFLNKRIEGFRMSKGEISKILNLKLLPSLDRIIKIEEALGVDILLVNYPKNYNLRDNERETSKTIYQAIINRYGNDFKKLEQTLKDKFHDICKQIDHNFVLRKTQNYLSVNIVPKDSIISGYHILFFRYNKQKHKKNSDEVLMVQFIVPNEYFKEQFQQYEKRYELNEGSAGTTYLPYKKAGKSKEEYIKKGHPWLYIKELNQEYIDLICNLALDVFKIQSN